MTTAGYWEWGNAMAHRICDLALWCIRRYYVVMSWLFSPILFGISLFHLLALWRVLNMQKRISSHMFLRLHSRQSMSMILVLFAFLDFGHLKSLEIIHLTYLHSSFCPLDAVKLHFTFILFFFILFFTSLMWMHIIDHRQWSMVLCMLGLCTRLWNTCPSISGIWKHCVSGQCRYGAIHRLYTIVVSTTIAVLQ